MTLVSGDRRAFHAAPDTDGLSPELARELLSIAGNVEVVSRLQDVVDAHVNREIAVLWEVERSLGSDLLRDQMLSDLGVCLGGHTLDALALRGFDVDDFDFELDLEPHEELTSLEIMSVDVQELLAVRSLSVIDARSLDRTGEATVDFEAELDAHVDVAIGADLRIRAASPDAGEPTIRQGGVVSTHSERRVLHVLGEAVLNESRTRVSGTTLASVRLPRRRAAAHE